MLKSCWVGIDPGRSGGIAAVDSQGRCFAYSMPATDVDVLECLRRFGTSVRFAVIEKVGGYIGPGSEMPGSAAFNFGKGYGALCMALTALEISHEEVTPQKWMSAFGMHRKKAEPKKEWKNRLKAKAQRLFPKTQVTLAVADALLIAEYCRRTRR